VALTINEWFKAQRFKNDYYLYVVMNTAGKTQALHHPEPNRELGDRREG